MIYVSVGHCNSSNISIRMKFTTYIYISWNTFIFYVIPAFNHSKHKNPRFAKTWHLQKGNTEINKKNASKYFSYQKEKQLMLPSNRVILPLSTIFRKWLFQIIQNTKFRNLEIKYLRIHYTPKIIFLWRNTILETPLSNPKSQKVNGRFFTTICKRDIVI